MEIGKIIFKIRIGSHLYGLNTENSDEDYLTVFIPKIEHILGLETIEEIDLSTNKTNERNNKEDIDDKYYSIYKYLRLLLSNNPNIIETLFVNEENIIIDSEEFQYLRNNYNKIVYNIIYKKFGGYAFSQRKKMVVKKDRYDTILDGIELIKNNNFNKITNEDEASALNRVIKYYKGKKENIEHFHKGMEIRMILNKLEEERDRYGWRVKTKTFETLGYDTKFGYHIIRLLGESIMLLNTGRITFPLKDELKDDIIKIRNGEINYYELLSMIDKYNILNEKANLQTELSNKPKYNEINNWLIKVIKKELDKNI